MENPAEETTVRPNQNQIVEDRNRPIQLPNSFCLRKNRNLSHPMPSLPASTIQSKAGIKLSLFWQAVSKNCHEKPVCGMDSGSENPKNSAFSVWLFGLPSHCMTLTEQMTRLAKHAKAASRELAKLTTAEKNACLLAMAAALEQNAGAIKQANALDMDAAAKSGLSPAMLDRLKLDDKRIAAMARGLREVAALPDPVGKILDERVRPNGLKLQKISTPIGVVVIIYESRPNVTADAASLCFKSGNATILRGGREAMQSNQIIAKTMIDAGKTALAFGGASSSRAGSQ